MISYLDLILSPNKGFHFVKNFPKYQILIAAIAMISLVIMIVNYFSSNKSFIKFKSISKMTFLIAALLIMNEIFFAFHFNSMNLIFDLLVTVSLSAPIVFIAKDFLNDKVIKNKYILTAGFLVAVSTFIYFKYFFVEYENYYAGYPIIFIIYWIRNWLIFVGVVLMIASTLNIYRAAKING